MSIRQDIVDYILNELDELKTSTGEYSRTYKYVGEWLLGITNDELDDYNPSIILLDENQDVIYNRQMEVTDFILHLRICVWSMGKVGQKTLRDSISDIYRCIGKHPDCEGLITNIVPIGDGIGLTQESKVIGDAEVKIDVYYTTKAWDLTKY